METTLKNAQARKLMEMKARGDRTSHKNKR
jgi:hypothetical protein